MSSDKRWHARFLLVYIIENRFDIVITFQKRLKNRLPRRRQGRRLVGFKAYQLWFLFRDEIYYLSASSFTGVGLPSIRVRPHVLQRNQPGVCLTHV